MTTRDVLVVVLVVLVLVVRVDTRPVNVGPIVDEVVVDSSSKDDAPREHYHASRPHNYHQDDHDPRHSRNH